FRDAFSKIMGTPPALAGEKKVFKASWLDTPLGPMVAIADERALFLLEFVDRRGLERELERLREKTNAAIIPGHTEPILSIGEELSLYFKGELTHFHTPLGNLGTPFQKRVWEELKTIPRGETRSYSEIASAIGRPSSYRAVARANGANQIAIVIPCHRVINASGELGGYGGGLTRKKWLVHHEKQGVIQDV
ncbi:methylated-DNA--[protein]-cysteine S-methyltransferase, partial [Halobacillus sp. BBL2006]|uniref:methylated-DNA--[protein]-cysteine S-methyltransferase n=1 Tax=Halobacillus sp. BBL2006 TaxID=1543706 RepID=UPI000543979A